MWFTRAPLKIARSHPAIASYKGKIYAFGGGGPAFLSLNSVEIYDPEEDRWYEGNPMPTARSGAVAAVMGDRIYVIGGGFRKADGKFQFLPLVEIYLPEKDAWITGPSMIQPHDYPGIALHEKRIYIMGGHHPDATEGGPSRDPGFSFCEVFDAGPGVWREISPLPVPRFALKGAVLNGRVLATGGVAFTGKSLTEYDRIDIYDPVEGIWTQKEGFSLPWPAAGHGVCIYRECLYIFGGYSTEGINSRVARYDPDMNQWEVLPSIDKPRAAMGIGVGDEGIYIIGGWEIDGRTVMDTVVLYRP